VDGRLRGHDGSETNIGAPNASRRLHCHHTSIAGMATQAAICVIQI
jgi:hypothetical protein